MSTSKPSYAVIWPRVGHADVSPDEQVAVIFGSEAEAATFVDGRLLRSDYANLDASNRPIVIPALSPAEAQRAVPTLVVA